MIYHIYIYLTWIVPEVPEKKNAASFKIIQDELSFSNKTHLESIYLASLEKIAPELAGDKDQAFFQTTRMSENDELPAPTPP